MVPIPDEADEDERRRVREREDLVTERVRLVNRIGAVLATLGCVTTMLDRLCWFARRSPNWSESATRCSMRRLPAKRRK